MDQPLPRRFGRLVVLLTLSAMLAANSGCVSALATAVYFIKGPDLPAEFKELKEKRVAVVCRPLVGLSYRDAGVAKDLAAEMSRLLRLNIRKIDVVDQRHVAAWIDENSWEEFAEVGEAVEADMVVGVDIEEFNIFQGQTVYQGRATVTLTVVDCQSGEVVFERHPSQIVYPPNSPRSTGDQREADFRREYLRVLADQLARHFYPHDPAADFAMDAAHIP